MEFPKWAPPRRGPEIDELVRKAVIKACGALQNMMQQNAWYDLVDAGGLTRLGIKYAVYASSDITGGCNYDPEANLINISEAMYNLLTTGKEDIKRALAREIGKAILLRPSYLAAQGIHAITDGRDNETSPCQECDPAWQVDYFVMSWLIPLPLLRKCRKDGMSETNMAKYFGVSLETLKRRIEML